MQGSKWDLRKGIDMSGRRPLIKGYLRKLLVVGAHAVLYHRKPHEDALRSWVKNLMQTKPFKLVAVALANKMARIAFTIMCGKTSYGAAPA
jgi:transposase